MAETHEPSYYEIALTNRQVIVAFVILLTCLMSAFFSGVWIGRESTSRAQERLASAGAQPPKPAAPDEGQNMEELEFFGDRQDSQPAQEDPVEEPAGQASGNDTTLLEDFAGDEPVEEEPVAEEPVEEPEPERVAPAPPVQEAPRATEEERPNRRERRNRQAERAEEPAAPAARPAARTAEPAIPRGSVVIQVFSSADETQAQRIRDQLTRGGYKAYLSPVERGGRTMYRVRIGPYGSRDDAETAAGNVRKSYKLDTWVTE